MSDSPINEITAPHPKRRRGRPTVRNGAVAPDSRTMTRRAVCSRARRAGRPPGSVQNDHGDAAQTVEFSEACHRVLSGRDDKHRSGQVKRRAGATVTTVLHVLGS